MLKPFNSRTYPLIQQYIISIVLVLGVSTICFYSTPYLGYRLVALILLTTTSFIAMIFEILPVLVAAVLSAVIWNFFFIPPLFTFHIDHAEDVLMFLLYFIIALVNAVLTSKIRKAETRARDREEKANTIKLYNTLLNSLSHELKTPIATILGAVDTLKENRDKLTSTDQNELLSEIDTASIRLNQQVENLLSMSRLESGTLKPKPDWSDVTELIHSVAQRVIADEHNVKIKIQENLPLFRLDGGLLEQVLYNLLKNAIQHTPVGTTIEIDISHTVNTCNIVISDNGPGFTQEEASKAFDKFYRSPDAKSGGIGLGLSIVKGFIEALNGTIRLENGGENGARFFVEIPAGISYINHLKNE